MPNAEALQWEEMLLADMRAHEGQVTQGPLTGHPLLVMTATGAKSGEPRRSILTFSRDGDAYVVAGTAGGSPVDPKWVANVAANPRVHLDFGDRSVEADGEVIAEGPERDRLWANQVATNPWFGDYPKQTGRVIPMIRLTPVDG